MAISFSYENPGGRGRLGCLLRREGDGISKLLQPLDVVTFDARLVQVIEVVGPEIGVRALVAQHIVEAHEDAVRDRDDRFVLAATTGNTLEEGAEVRATGPRRRPRDLAEDGTRPDVAFGCLPG